MSIAEHDPAERRAVWLALVLTFSLSMVLLLRPESPESMTVVLHNSVALAIVPASEPAPRQTEPSESVMPDPPAPQAVAGPRTTHHVIRSVARPVLRAAPLSSPIEPAAAPPTALPVDHGGETSFVARLRAYIRSIAHYPSGSLARRERPQGTTEVTLTLARDGTALAAEISQGSGSALLDDQALATIRSGTYPPFPDSAWPGEARHAFTVRVDFVLDSATPPSTP